MSKGAITSSSTRKGRGRSPSPTRSGISRRGLSAASSGRPVGHGGPEVRYPVVIHKEKGSDYGVSVPDLPGCFSAARTMQEALESAREAVAAHIEGMLLDGDRVPTPTSIDVHKENPDYAGGVWALVPVDLGKFSGRAKRINITLPERALTVLDACAKSFGETRSGFLLRAALEFIARHRAA
jgi:predicted RNase H-like HicB family nuclease